MLKRKIIYILSFSPSLFYTALFAKEWIGHTLRRVHDDDFLFFKNCVRLNPEGQFIDIGANLGQSALSFSVVDKNREIVSFEPNTTLEPYLRIVKKLLGRRYNYFKIGIGERAASMELAVPRLNNIMLTGEASFDLGEVESDMVRERIGHNYVICNTTCEVAKFDDLVEKYNLNPFLIKMDIQGFELAALRGMRDCISRWNPIFMIERNSDAQFEEMKGFFDKCNYLVLYYDPRENALLQTDPHFSASFFAFPKESFENQFKHLLHDPVDER